MTTNTQVPYLALETVLYEGGMIRKGDMHSSEDPLVARHAKYFIAADATSAEVRKRQAELLADSAVGAFEYPAPPPAVRMRAVRDVVVERTTTETLPAGTIVLSDSDDFIRHARDYEPADAPTKRRRK